MINEEMKITFLKGMERLKKLGFNDFIIQNGQLIYSVENKIDLLNPIYGVFAFAAEHDLINWNVYGKTKITINDNLNGAVEFSKDGKDVFSKSGLFAMIGSYTVGYTCSLEEFIMENITIWKKEAVGIREMKYVLN